MFRRFNKLRDLTPQRRAALLDAAWTLTMVRLDLALRPFRRTIGIPQQHPGDVSLPEIETAQRTAHEHVAWAIKVAARNLPFECDCLPQAIAGQRMLSRQGIRGMLVLGVTSGPGLDDDEKLAAHAWVVVGDDVLIGETGFRRFTPVGAFPW